MKNIDKLVHRLYDFIFAKKEDKENNERILRKELDKLPQESQKVIRSFSAKELIREAARYNLFKEANKNKKTLILRNIHKSIHNRKKNRNNNLRSPIMRVAACAAAIICICVGYLLITNRKAELGITNQHIPLAHEIKPGGSKAYLTLDDGQVIPLDSLSDGIVSRNGLHYADGRTINPSLSGSKNVMLTLETPRGGEYIATLSDGSRVHMNAESKLIYPLAFTGDTREVTLHGEAYFDVASDKRKPFQVHTKNKNVIVLGTSFNIRSYADEQFSFVTLIEGKVRLNDGYKNPELTPGMQSISDGTRTLIKTVNTEDFISWKNGLLTFHNENLKAVATKISRWYDIEIQVAPSAEKVRIWGSVSRYDTFDKVLEVLQLIDKNLKINIDGRRVYIMK